MRCITLLILISLCPLHSILGCTAKPEPNEEEVHPQQEVKKMKPEEMKVRPPVVAGMFYDGRKGDLERQLASFFRAAEFDKPEGTVRALISPHAGFVYSGPVAGALSLPVQRTE